MISGEVSTCDACKNPGNSRLVDGGYREPWGWWISGKDVVCSPPCAVKFWKNSLKDVVDFFRAKPQAIAMRIRPTEDLGSISVRVR